MRLSDAHRAQLRASAIADDVIRERGYRSVNAAEVRHLKTEHGIQMFSNSQCRSGLLIPLHATDGSNSLYVLRPDNPRVTDDGKVIKYEFPRNQPMRLDCPPRCRPMLGNPSIPLWLTEGQKKGDALASHGLCAIALLGVWNFKAKNSFGGTVLLADWDYIALNGRIVNIVFDSDVMTKPEVRKALDRLTEHLHRKGGVVNAVYLPNLPDGSKCGVDDFLLTHSVADLEALVQVPRPVAQPAKPRVELLDDAPLTLTRPLQLINGRTYAATWWWVRETTTEITNKKGEVCRLSSPIVETKRRTFVVRDDGLVFGDGGDKPLDELSIEVKLNDAPPDHLLLSAKAVRRFRAGAKPDAVSVFERIVSAYDYYIDFSRSLGGQQQMCRFSACLSIATWLTDAFDVMGYPWPNGEKGSGKTKWATIWTKTSYLGMMVTCGGSFAALRDLAEHGAALAFDDAENLADPKRSDPDKRALLLAGNRRGVQIPFKELVGDRWQTRWVNTYAPRAFTAISAPDAVLYSRSILIPLVRTGDKMRANRDPGRTAHWPVDVKALRDDLWLLALTLLPEASDVWRELEGETEAGGRDLEPWRAALATARLLEHHGVPNLEVDVRTIMRNYFDERDDYIPSDRQRAVALAVVRFAEKQIESSLGRKLSDVSDVSELRTLLFEGWTFSAKDVVDMLKVLAVDGEDEGIEVPEWVTPKVVGWQLSKLRVRCHRTPDKRRTRQREINLSELQGFAAAFSINTKLADIFIDPGIHDVRTSELSETSDDETIEVAL